MLKKLPVVLLVVNLVLLDAIVIYSLIKPSPGTSNQIVDIMPLSVGEVADNSKVDYCDTVCIASLNGEISNLKNQISELNVTPVVPTSKPNPTSAPRTKSRSVSYIPVPGAGSTLSTSWVNLAGTDFYLNKSDFSGLKSVNFEANMKLVNGNGTAYLRVFDVTHGIGVNGSDVSTSSQSSVFVSSSSMSLWEGNNHYIIQARSLTSDTTVFESGKIKITVEN